MNSSGLRQRRRDQPAVEQPDVDLQQPHPYEISKDVRFGVAFAALLFTRYISARSNIVHDCDEVFNYWEPLHFLLYKSGFQTWEYSSEFALRSYLYLLLHAIVGVPASFIMGKVNVFYLVRFALAATSAACDGALVASVSKKFGKRIAIYTLVLLCFTSGCYTASTTFLPSTFSMYAISLATAALLADRPDIAVAISACGVLIGWPFAGLAVVPLVIYSLVNGGFYNVFMAGFKTSISLIALSAIVDRYFYGQWKLSVLNLVMYNVVGGGDSILYGVEGPLFYIRNAFNNFNIAFLLALNLPTVLLLVRRSTDKLLLLVILPLYVWLGFMSLQPHKEERFLYPVYPLICLACAATIERLPDMVPSFIQRGDYYHIIWQGLKTLRPILLSFILVVSYGRTMSLLHGYSAPMRIYHYLPSDINAPSTVCIGSEWHRFPSSFFIPSPKYEVKWLNDGFGGLLPLPFNSTLGGTASAPPYLNRANKASPQQFLEDESTCDYLVELVLDRANVQYRGNDTRVWQVIMQHYFLDNEKSPALYRAFFIPWAWQTRNTFGTYRLLKRKGQH